MQTCNRSKKVAVVGGGLSGLAAAHRISTNGELEVIVVEASFALGGRIKQITGLVPWPVEIGPEFLHGKHNSAIKSIADELGCQVRELPYPDRYYFGEERKLLTADEAENHSDIRQVHDIFAELAVEDHPMTDISMLEFLHKKGVKDTVIQLAESIYANDFGCSLEQLGLSECIHEARNWIYGDTYIVLDRPLSCITNYLAQGLEEIHLNHVVEEIDYSSNSGVLLKCRGGATMFVDYVILTVPVSILQANLIQFVPPLPKEKTEAIAAIGMSTVVKVLLAFSERFWPMDLFDIVCTKCFLPEIWTTSYPSEAAESEISIGKHLMVGFMAGQAAVAVSDISQDEIFSRSLSQLDEMFGKSVASKKFVGGKVIMWKDEPFIRGGYTYPSLHGHGARQKLAKAVMGRLFFAGEATHSGVNPCLQAAMETGIRAANEVILESHTNIC